jgi:hypothetical protein
MKKKNNAFSFVVKTQWDAAVLGATEVDVNTAVTCRQGVCM